MYKHKAVSTCLGEEQECFPCGQVFALSVPQLPAGAFCTSHLTFLGQWPFQTSRQTSRPSGVSMGPLKWGSQRPI